MRFRPCIDIHNGAVKQIVGSTLSDGSAAVKENFVSGQSAADFARLYREKGLLGGHVILLNKAGTPGYDETLQQAKAALSAYPGGLQVGGGITDRTAASFLEAGASAVIVTSFAFTKGQLDLAHLYALRETVGAARIVLDLSCRRLPDGYHILCDRWQTDTGVLLTPALFERLSAFCGEYLIHATDVEGKQAGCDLELLALLGSLRDHPVTYAGGIATIEDIRRAAAVSAGRVDITIGSALSCFGGPLELDDVIRETEAW